MGEQEQFLATLHLEAEMGTPAQIFILRSLVGL